MAKWIRNSRTLDALFCGAVLAALIWMLVVDAVWLPTARSVTVPTTQEAVSEPIAALAPAEVRSRVH